MHTGAAYPSISTPLVKQFDECKTDNYCSNLSLGHLLSTTVHLCTATDAGAMHCSDHEYS